MRATLVTPPLPQQPAPTGRSAINDGMLLLGGDSAEALWMVVGTLLLALTLTGLILAWHRSDFWWFVAMLLLGPLAAAVYLGRRRVLVRRASRVSAA